MKMGVLYLGLAGSGGGNSSVYNEGLLAVLERMGRLVCLRGLTNNAISASKLAAIFSYINLGLGWLDIKLVFTILVFQIFGIALSSQNF